jgi:hypothetical protein
MFDLKTGKPYSFYPVVISTLDQLGLLSDEKNQH